MEGLLKMRVGLGGTQDCIESIHVLGIIQPYYHVAQEFLPIDLDFRLQFTEQPWQVTPRDRAEIKQHQGAELVRRHQRYHCRREPAARGLGRLQLLEDWGMRCTVVPSFHQSLCYRGNKVVV